MAGDGQYCFTAGRDRLVKLWNPHTALLLKTYKGHGNDVTDAQACDCIITPRGFHVCSSRDSSKFISGGADRQIMWDVGTGGVRGMDDALNVWQDW